MNNYGLLVTSPIGKTKNIGDYIQSLAALQFIGKDYTIIEKEQISKFYSKDKVKVIMNAWYMWHPEYWPPQECIEPLLTSIHITPITADRMLNIQGKEYFLKHAPIGCRDTGTLDILQKYNVPCYFSGCLTLTLGETYKYEGDRKGIIFVDPYFPPIRYKYKGGTIYYPMNVLKSLGYFIFSPQKITKLAKKKFFKGRFFLQTYYNASIFYHSYSSMFTDEVLMNAEYISHMVPVSHKYTQEELLNEAELLVKKYAKAKLVVTSRIHCALPCIGLETPLIFVLDKIMESNQNIFNAPNRFGGLLDFFRVVEFSGNRLKTIDTELRKIRKVSSNTFFKNKQNWQVYKEKLVMICKEFVK